MTFTVLGHAAQRLHNLGHEPGRLIHRRCRHEHLKNLTNLNEMVPSDKVSENIRTVTIRVAVMRIHHFSYTVDPDPTIKLDGNWSWT